MVLNVHTPTEDKTDDVKDRFYDVQCVFDKFPKYLMKILLGDCNAKVGSEGIFKPTMGMRVCTKLSHIQKSDCQNYNVPTL
jgi:hypothetical protein